MQGTSVVKIGNYRLGRTVGNGSFGKVKIAEHEVTGHKVAVKIIDKNFLILKKMDHKVKREIQILKLFRHPHIIKLYEVIETTQFIFLIMEYVSGGELFEYIVKNGRLTEEEARKFFQEIISAVNYCHKHAVVHRDLKPENLLLTEKGHIKIGDFGLSNIISDGDFFTTCCGSPNYAAPEIISGKLYSGVEVDVWSCGVILFTLVCGKLPFDDQNMVKLFEMIKKGFFDFPKSVKISTECMNLIRGMIQVDPLKRLTISEIRADKWFSTNCPDYLFSPESLGTSFTSAEKIDVVVLNELALRFGMQVEEAKSILRGENTSGNEETEEERETRRSLTVAYDLITDFKSSHKSIPTATSSTNSERKESFVGTSSLVLINEPKPVILRDEPVFSPKASDTGEAPPNFEDPTANSASISSYSERHKNTWYLGITFIQDYELIMAQLFKVLKQMDFSWKIINPFSLRCLTKSKLPNSGGDKQLKLSIQLYTVDPPAPSNKQPRISWWMNSAAKDTGSSSTSPKDASADKNKDGHVGPRYLLDFKKLEGETFMFFSTGSVLLRKLTKQLRSVSKEKEVY